MFDWYMDKQDEKNMIDCQNSFFEKHKFECMYELIPIDGRKSFNGRCKVLYDDCFYYLMSYNTIVCWWNENKKVFCKTWDEYSQTTMRHINAFMRHIGFTLGNKKWWTALPYGVELTISDFINIV